MKSDVKLRLDELNVVLKSVNVVDNKLSKIDRERMSFSNKVGDVVRDLPVIDFLDPYYKVNQIVVRDIKYDVNFAAVPQVDRCTSCHLGIENPDFLEIITKENATMTVDDIRNQSPILKELETQGLLNIVGAYFDLDTGKVTILD